MCIVRLCSRRQPSFVFKSKINRAQTLSSHRVHEVCRLQEEEEEEKRKKEKTQLYNNENDKREEEEQQQKQNKIYKRLPLSWLLDVCDGVAVVSPRHGSFVRSLATRSATQIGLYSSP